MAQTITPRFEAQLANNLRWARGYLWAVEYNEYMHDNDSLISFKITTDLQKDAAIFGNTICKYAETKAQNPGNLIRPVVGGHIDLYVGLTLDISQPTQDIEYLNQGRFTLYDIKYDEDNETFTTYHYDDMVKFNIKYFENGNVYPMTLGNFVSSLCMRVGLELGNPDFYNSDFVIEQPNVAANEYTFRDLLGWAAELAVGNAIIGRDGKVYIKSYGDTSVFTITPELYTKFKKTDTFGPINSVYMLREALGDNVVYPDPQPLNPITYKIIDNMLAYDQREDIIESIYDEVNGTTYTPFQLEWRGTGHLDFMDKITIIDTNGISYDSYVMNQVLNFDGALSETLSAVAYSPVETAITNSGTSSTKNRLTEAKVNKVDGEITLVVAEIDGLDQDISQLTLDVSSIEATVSDHEGRVGSLEVSSAAISAQVSDNEGAISALELTTQGLSLSVQNYEDGELSGANYTFDGTGATFTNGALTIQNNAHQNVLYADTNGNLHLKGTLEAVNGTFSGTLSAVGGTFTGTLSGANGNFSGDVTTNNLDANGGKIGGFTIGADRLSSSSSGRQVALIDATDTSYYGLKVIEATYNGLETYYQAGKILNYNGGNPFPLQLNGSSILTTSSAPSASVKGPVTISYDDQTNTLYIGT